MNYHFQDTYFAWIITLSFSSGCCWILCNLIFFLFYFFLDLAQLLRKFFQTAYGLNTSKNSTRKSIYGHHILLAKLNEMGLFLVAILIKYEKNWPISTWIYCFYFTKMHSDPFLLLLIYKTYTKIIFKIFPDSMAQWIEPGLMHQKVAD